METFVVVRLTKRGMQIGQVEYSLEEANKVARKLELVGIAVQVMELRKALGLE